MKQTKPIEIPVPRETPYHPPKLYDELRRAQPIAKVRTPRGDEAWLITRYDDIRKVLSDSRFSADPNSLGYPAYFSGDFSPPPGFFMFSDAPDHSRLRSLVTKELIGKAITDMQPTMQKITDHHLNLLVDNRKSAELIQDFAYPVSSGIICELLGVPTDDQSFLQKLVDTTLDRSVSSEKQLDASAQIMKYFDRIVRHKMIKPSDDILGRLIDDPERMKQIDHDELAGLAALILLGAYDTMAQMIGLGVLSLLDNPDQLSQIVKQSGHSNSFVDELVRFHTVNHSGLPRAALTDVEIGGVIIKAGDGVIAMLNSGNRDDKKFDHANELDFSRKAKSHLGFGHGIHKCIGVQYAKAELGIVFSSLFRKLPNLKINADKNCLKFRHEMVLYGVKQLPIAW